MPEGQNKSDNSKHFEVIVPRDFEQKYKLFENSELGTCLMKRIATKNRWLIGFILREKCELIHCFSFKKEENAVKGDMK